MQLTIAALIAGLWSVQAGALLSEIQIETEQLDAGSSFAFEKIASPAINDAGANATWKLIDGDR